MTLQLRLAELDEYIEFECRVPSGSSAGGQFSRCGKAFSRMSAHPDQRRKPIPGFSLDLSPEDDAEAAEILGSPTARAENVIRSAYEGDLGGGFRSVVTGLRPYIPTARNPEGRPSVEVVGRILDADGRRVGDFIRRIVRDDRTLIADHELLELASSVQGQGIADRFNARAIAVYEAMGVDRITLSAAMTHGGFAWARQGFRVAGTPADRHAIIDRLAKGVRIDEYTGKVNGHARTHPTADDSRELAALQRASAAGEDIQPIHLASIGESRKGDSDTWFGKDLLLGATWPGVYYLDRANPVTASAVDLHYADMRPAFRLSTEDYACHSKACAPPPAGTGGSLPEGWTKGARIDLDPDTDEPTEVLLTTSVGFKSVNDSEELHGSWEDAREGFMPSPSWLFSFDRTPEFRAKAEAWQQERHEAMMQRAGTTIEVRPGEVHAAQEILTRSHVEALAKNSSGRRNPFGIRINGEVYVMDGHHRVTSAWLRGEAAKLDVIDLQKLLDTTA